MSEVGIGRLKLRTEGDNYRVWMNKDGISYNANAPIVESETYFPMFDNPLQVLHIILNQREKYDHKECKTLQYLPEYGGRQMRVLRTITRKNIVDPRECIEKKVYFSLG